MILPTLKHFANDSYLLLMAGLGLAALLLTVLNSLYDLVEKVANKKNSWVRRFYANLHGFFKKNLLGYTVLRNWFLKKKSLLANSLLANGSLTEFFKKIFDCELSQWLVSAFKKMFSGDTVSPWFKKNTFLRTKFSNFGAVKKTFGSNALHHEYPNLHFVCIRCHYQTHR